jgi:eukaryotic-like serine/threonine-protein kinase
MTGAPPLVQDRYRLGRTLGAGGMGRVWLARDVTLDRDVAVKEILLPDALVEADRDALRRQMLREARASARLSHPNVARVYDAFEADGRAWIVMEYVASRSLQQVIDADGPMPPEGVARVGLQVLEALATAHKAGVRHRDVKPANVLIGDDGRVVLTDFGVAAVDGESIVTSSGLVVGSPQYMAPERLRDGEAHAAGDLWSLGATLYAAVEGRPPYRKASVMETVTAIAADEPEPPRRAGAMSPVLDGLLRKDPGERIDAAETERRLRLILAPPPVRRRHPWVWVAALLVLVAGGVTWAVLRPQDRTAPSAQMPATAPTTNPPASPSVAPSTPQPSTPQPSTPAPSPTRPVLPDGWVEHRDPTGFSVYVPEGWKRSKEGSMVYFRTAGRSLGIDQTDEPQPDPVADWEGKAEFRVGRGDFPGYDELHIREVDYFRKAADWQFTFESSGVRQRVNNRGFITSPDQAYGIWWQTRESDWAAAEDDLELVFASFRPKP